MARRALETYEKKLENPDESAGPLSGMRCRAKGGGRKKRSPGEPWNIGSRNKNKEDKDSEKRILEMLDNSEKGRPQDVQFVLSNTGKTENDNLNVNSEWKCIC